jgi:hypothetical protein
MRAFRRTGALTLSALSLGFVAGCGDSGVPAPTHHRGD